jgi:integrase
MVLWTHNLRTTFITLALAAGRSETWVADRTGHKSSQMINRYRQAARTATEIGLGWLVNMASAIPELRDLDQKLDRPLPRVVGE